MMKNIVIYLSCLIGSIGTSVCESSPLHITLIGDSFMDRLTPELARIFENKASLTQEYLPATATESTITDLTKNIIASHSTDLIVIAYGEDSLASAISQSSYISNVRNLLNGLSPSNKKIMWVNIPPVPPGFTEWSNSAVVQRNNSVVNLVNDRKCITLDIYEYISLRQNDLQNQMKRGLNQTGWELIASFMAGRIEELLQEGSTQELPCVLLLGDSISNGYNIPVREMLSGKANVYQLGSGFTCPVDWDTILQSIKSQERKQGAPFSVIHFNWGLHALKYIDSQGKLSSVSEGRRCVPPEKYAEELNFAIDALEKTDATIIWATTTPEHQVVWAKTNDAKLYNKIAEEVVKKRNIPMNDLFSIAQKENEFNSPHGCHFTAKGSRILATNIVNIIHKYLSP
jgi:hypothetical protein